MTSSISWKKNEMKNKELTCSDCKSIQNGICMEDKSNRVSLYVEGNVKCYEFVEE